MSAEGKHTLGKLKICELNGFKVIIENSEKVGEGILK
jgi:hypothetical protein